MQKVLVVHKSAAFRAVLRRKLSVAGFDCIEAGDVLAGLQRAVEDRPDAVIIDAALGGLDASEMRSVLASDPATQHLPVLLCAESSIPGRAQAEAEAQAQAKAQAKADADARAQIRTQTQATLLLWSESRAVQLEFSPVRA